MRASRSTSASTSSRATPSRAAANVVPSKPCAVSIDLDSIACYYRIHGLGVAPVELEHVILERALPRAAALFAARGLHVTWFVVGRDADGDAELPDRAARA